MLRQVSIRASQARVKPMASRMNMRASAMGGMQGSWTGGLQQHRPLVSTVLLSSETYDKKPVTELRAILQERQLATNGRKSDLVQRLKQNDLQRAGSTLATQAASDSARPKPARRSSSRAPKGKEAVEKAEKENPAVSLEPGSVASPAELPDGSIGKSSPKPTDDAPHKPTSPPGLPAEKAEPISEHFNIKVPTSILPDPVEQYIPSIKAYVDPSHDYSESFKDDWHMMRAPRVHALGAGDQNVSHNATLDIEHALQDAKPGMLMQLAQDAVSKALHKDIKTQLDHLKSARQGLLGDVINDLKQTIPKAGPPPQVSAPKGRPSTRRALNDEEKRGLGILAAILTSGFLLGGLALEKPKPKPSSSLSHPTLGNAKDNHGTTQVYEPPHYEHGGQIVGAGPRKV